MRLLFACFLLLVFGGLFPPVFAQDWEPLGPNDWNWPSLGAATPRVAVDGNNNPIVLSKDFGVGGGYPYQVRRWNGTMWITFDMNAFFADDALVRMVLDDAGNPVVAGTDPSNGDRLMVRRWNGTAWAPMGAEGISTGEVIYFSLAKDASGRFVMAYIDESLAGHVVVKRWTGSDWELIGSDSFSDPNAYALSFVLDAFGNPVVNYTANTGVHLSRVQRWTGAIWETLPPINLGNSPIGGGDIAINSAGNPIVILASPSLGYRPVVVNWNGTTWETIGPLGISVANSSGMQIEIDAEGRPVIMFKDYGDGTKVRRWNGSVWETHCAIDPYLAVEDSKFVLAPNGDVVVASQSWSLGYRAIVQRWNGTEWFDFGERSISQHGAFYSSMAMNANGDVAMVYSEPIQPSRNTVLLWNDQTWEVVGEVGISDGHAAHNSIALDSLGYPIVAYADYANAGLTVMRWNGAFWEPVGPPGFSSDFPIGISLKLNSNSMPIVAYKIDIEIADYYKVNVVAWDGTSWNNIGSFPGYWASGAMGFDLDSNGYPIVGFHNTSIGGPAILQWNGSSWTEMPVISAYQSSSFQDLVIDANDDPIVASNGTLRKWNGASWEIIGAQGDVGMKYLCLSIGANNDLLVGGLELGRATIRRWTGRHWQGVGSERFTTGFSALQGPRWFQANKQRKVAVAYTNGGLYAKAMEYTASDPGIYIQNDVLTIGPNPNSGESLWISLGALPSQAASVEVTLHDVAGKRVGEQVLPVTYGDLNTEMNLPLGLANGMYVVSVVAGESRWSTRLIVARP